LPGPTCATPEAPAQGFSPTPRCWLTVAGGVSRGRSASGPHPPEKSTSHVDDQEAFQAVATAKRTLPVSHPSTMRLNHSPQVVPRTSGGYAIKRPQRPTNPLRPFGSPSPTGLVPLVEHLATNQVRPGSWVRMAAPKMSHTFPVPFAPATQCAQSIAAGSSSPFSASLSR